MTVHFTSSADLLRVSGTGEISALFGRFPAAFALLSGPGHVLEAANPAFFDAAGVPPGGTGQPIAGLMPELVGQGLIAVLDRVFDTGEPFVAADSLVTLGVGPKARQAYFDFTYEPWRDEDGQVTGVMVLAIETTGLKSAVKRGIEHRALLERIARDEPLKQVLEGMAAVIERLCPGALASILLADPAGTYLYHGAAPSLPDFYNTAIDGIATGEGVGACGTAAHRRRPVIAADIATDPFWADFRDLAGRAGLAACWSTPILAADGALLGTFAMYHRAPNAPQESDLALCADFARTAALAIERDRDQAARRGAEARERAARADLNFVLDASSAIALDLDFAASLQRLAQLSVPVLAPLCAVEVLEGARIRRVATAAADARALDLMRSYTPVYPSHGLVARVLRNGRPESAATAPDSPGPWPELGVTGYLCVPLSARGRTFGVLTLLTTNDGPPDEHTVALAQELARRASSSADNARQYTERVHLARDLQAGLLLAQPPTVPGLSIATHYAPAGEGLEVGGDFYDVFAIGPDRWAFMIGDVCGRGALAATTTGLVRHTARAAARLIDDPAQVVQAVHAALLERPYSRGADFVTLVFGHLYAEQGAVSLELVRAGHVAPLIRDADGRVRELAPAGTLLGITGPAPVLPTASATMQPGESLLLVTDGFTEARSATGEFFGEERLARALAGEHGARPADAQAVLDNVVDTLDKFTRGNDSADDRAALVLTVL